MKYNISETEKGFAALQTGITVFIANAIANYEAALEEAKLVLEKNNKEIEKLKKELTILKPESEPEKEPKK